MNGEIKYIDCHSCGQKTPEYEMRGKTCLFCLNDEYFKDDPPTDDETDNVPF